MKTLLYIAAVCQFGILIASALVPRALSWKKNLANLHPFIRRLFWVYGCFIVLIIIGFSLLTFANAQAMANGDPVARSLCILIAVFWAARLFVQFAVFDARPFLTNWIYKTAYHMLTIGFTLLVATYTMAALHPGSTPVSGAGESVSLSRTFKDRSGETVRAGLAFSPTLETSALPGIARPSAAITQRADWRKSP